MHNAERGNWLVVFSGSVCEIIVLDWVVDWVCFDTINSSVNHCERNNIFLCCAYCYIAILQYFDASLHPCTSLKGNYAFSRMYFIECNYNLYCYSKSKALPSPALGLCYIIIRLNFICCLVKVLLSPVLQCYWRPCWGTAVRLETEELTAENRRTGRKPLPPSRARTRRRGLESHPRASTRSRWTGCRGEASPSFFLGWVFHKTSSRTTLLQKWDALQRRKWKSACCSIACARWVESHHSDPNIFKAKPWAFFCALGFDNSVV